MVEILRDSQKPMKIMSVMVESTLPSTKQFHCRKELELRKGGGGGGKLSQRERERQEKERRREEEETLKSSRVRAARFTGAKITGLEVQARESYLSLLQKNMRANYAEHQKYATEAEATLAEPLSEADILAAAVEEEYKGPNSIHS